MNIELEQIFASNYPRSGRYEETLRRIRSSKETPDKRILTVDHKFKIFVIPAVSPRSIAIRSRFCLRRSNAKRLNSFLLFDLYFTEFLGLQFLHIYTQLHVSDYVK